MSVHAAAVSRSRKGRNRLRTLAYEITIAEARERERIALGLHDDIGQFLTLARLKLGELRACVPGGAGEPLFDDIHALLAQAARATRSATFDLSSPVLRLGLEQALHSLADRLARDSRLHVSFLCSVPPPALPEAVLAVVFRGVRELCLNVQKHAGAQRVDIAVRCEDGRLAIEVVDDGAGFVPAPRQQFSRAGGFGLASAQVQMLAIGGQLDICSVPGAGTRARILVPLAARGRA
ncbi:ATP-binding protein [Pseudorhodoferax sp. LjRoot39]|uniref:sensor histidine kinase n=1 Tax=Pseudorhodoferax sp. LjRoot39 TaxID=3342328 RepID=UPI003ECD94AE